MAKDFIGEQGVIITAGRTFDFTDETGAGADDGTPITKEKVMQLMAVFQHLMLDAGYVHNGLVENAVSQTPGDTQYYDALVARMVAAIADSSDWAASINTVARRATTGELRCIVDPTIDGYLSGNSNDSKTIVANMGYVNSRAIPVGTALPFCSATLPAGWLECNGANISRTTYPLLFAAIGTTWGSGDGSTTFTLPDFRNRMLAGAYPSPPAGSKFSVPADANTPLGAISVGSYVTLSGLADRFLAGVKFMIRAL